MNMPVSETPVRHASATLHDLIQQAAFAPSSHNSQPWHFIVGSDSISLCADRTRALPVIDPFDRELVISCGAALFNLRVALCHAGFLHRIQTFPSEIDTDLLAQIRIDENGYCSPALAELNDAIALRVTTRASFDAAPVPPTIQRALIEAGTLEGAQVVCIDSLQMRTAIAELIAEADHAQFSSPRFRRELASWIDARRHEDGMPAFAAGVPALLDQAAPIAASVVRTFDLGNGLAAMHHRLVEASPLLLCISTVRDDAPAWLDAGQALERILLVAARAGYTASYLNQPIEVSGLREQLATLLDLPGYPQQLIRIGIGPKTRHSPRRALGDVIS